MSYNLEEQLDSMDATIFSGDCLWTDFDLVYEYVNRWKRECDKYKESFEKCIEENSKEE